MVGNSFSESHNMEEMIQAMVNERKIVLQASSVFAARYEEGGMNLTHFASQPELQTMISDRSWTWVVLQEQSQTSGFYPPAKLSEIYDNSVKSVLALDTEIQAVGGTTVLFETWGYFGKDPYNPTFYTDYQTMQNRITRGYEIYKEDILERNPQARVKIAPAGLAFERVFKHIKDTEGKDPLEKGSLFDLLYEEEKPPRKHPSAYGSYLCGCVLFQTLTGLDVRQSSFAPAGVEPTFRKLLQTVAYDTVRAYNGDDPSNGTPNNKYAIPSSTPVPYVPASDKGRRRGSFSGFVRSFMTLAVVCGVGFIAYTNRQEIVNRLPFNLQVSRYQRHRERGYGFEALSSGANMELSDVQGSAAHEPML